MPYDKGDFTQQGVAGHVNAILRLNEKRLVGIDLTSNEEAEGCTIAGAVYDLLNNEVYPVGAGVSGNIEITENGENINVAPYATATVNVSGSGGLDLLHTDLTITNESAVDVSLLNIPLTVYGYSILISDIVTQAPNLLKTSVDDNTDLAIELNLLGLTIPANGSISIPLYYITKNTTAPDCYINTTLTGSNLVNMASGEENYFDVTDATENSSITLTIAK